MVQQANVMKTKVPVPFTVRPNSGIFILDSLLVSNSLQLLEVLHFVDSWSSAEIMQGGRNPKTPQVRWALKQAARQWARDIYGPAKLSETSFAYLFQSGLLSDHGPWIPHFSLVIVPEPTSSILKLLFIQRIIRACPDCPDYSSGLCGLVKIKLSFHRTYFILAPYTLGFHNQAPSDEDLGLSDFQLLHNLSQILTLDTSVYFTWYSCITGLWHYHVVDRTQWYQTMHINLPCKFLITRSFAVIIPDVIGWNSAWVFRNNSRKILIERKWPWSSAVNPRYIQNSHDMKVMTFNYDIKAKLSLNMTAYMCNGLDGLYLQRLNFKLLPICFNAGSSK